MRALTGEGREGLTKVHVVSSSGLAVLRVTTTTEPSDDICKSESSEAAGPPPPMVNRVVVLRSDEGRTASFSVFAREKRCLLFYIIKAYHTSFEVQLELESRSSGEAPLASVAPHAILHDRLEERRMPIEVESANMTRSDALSTGEEHR